MSFYDKIIPNPLALKAVEKISYTKALFEHYYYKLLNSQSYSSQFQINFTVVTMSCFLLGFIAGRILFFIWKPYNQLSFVELGAFVYTWYHIGHYVGGAFSDYIMNVSLGRFNDSHKKYNFEKIESIPGNSYLNPIDLTQNNATDKEAVDVLLSFMKEPNETPEKEIKKE